MLTTQHRTLRSRWAGPALCRAAAAGGACAVAAAAAAGGGGGGGGELSQQRRLEPGREPRPPPARGLVRGRERGSRAAAGRGSASPPPLQPWRCAAGPCAQPRRSPGAASDAGPRGGGGACGEAEDAGAGGGDAGDEQPLPRSRRCTRPSFL